MWAKDRHHLINAKLAVNAYVSVDELVEELQVSRETIRRDIVQLEGEGKLRRVHGGVERSEVSNEPRFVDRMRVNAVAKKRIGVAAARLVQPGMLVSVDAGTTALTFAKAMASIPDVTIISNSAVAINVILAIRPDADVVLIGGHVIPEIPGTFGEMATSSIRHYIPDLGVFSPVGLDVYRGATDFHQSEAEFAHALIHSAKKTVALADTSKLGTVSRVEICACKEIDILVTEKGDATEEIKAIRAAGIQEIIVA